MLSGRKQELDQRYNEQYHAANTNQNVYQAVQTQQSQMQNINGSTRLRIPQREM